MSDPALALALVAGLAGPLLAVDGDTVKVSATGQRLRLAAIDAPERHGRAECLEEWLAAEAATRRLAELLAGAHVVWSGRSDGWNRPLVAIVLPDGRDAGAVLVAEGLARDWTGQTGGWCD